MTMISQILFTILIYQLFLLNRAEETTAPSFNDGGAQKLTYIEQTFASLRELSDERVEKLFIVLRCFPIFAIVFIFLALLCNSLLKRYRKHEEDKLKLAEEGLAFRSSEEEETEDEEQ